MFHCSKLLMLLFLLTFCFSVYIRSDPRCDVVYNVRLILWRKYQRSLLIFGQILDVTLCIISCWYYDLNTKYVYYELALCSVFVLSLSLCIIENTFSLLAHSVYLASISYNSHLNLTFVFSGWNGYHIFLIILAQIGRMEVQWQSMKSMVKYKEADNIGSISFDVDFLVSHSRAK